MATYLKNTSGQIQTGVVLVLFGEQAPYGASVERSPDGLTGWTQVGSFDDIDQSGTAFFDYLPLDNTTRYYRAKLVEEGYTDGPYTDVLPAKPSLIPDADYDAKPWLLSNSVPLQLVMDVFSESSSSLHVTASINRDPASSAQLQVRTAGSLTSQPVVSVVWHLRTP
jgi:hypothetical protein